MNVEGVIVERPNRDSWAPTVLARLIDPTTRRVLAEFEMRQGADIADAEQYAYDYAKAEGWVIEWR